VQELVAEQPQLLELDHELDHVALGELDAGLCLLRALQLREERAQVAAKGVHFRKGAAGLVLGWRGGCAKAAVVRFAARIGEGQQAARVASSDSILGRIISPLQGKLALPVSLEKGEIGWVRGVC